MSARLDLVLVNPSSRQRVYQGLGQELAAIEPPVWAGLMATYVRLKGKSVVIIDAEAEGLSHEQAAIFAMDLKPRLVAIPVYGHQPSASTQIMPAAGALAAALKLERPDVPVMMLGGHVAVLPQRTMEEETIDFACGGEGLFTLVGLLDALASSRPDFSEVPDLWYRQERQIIASTRRAPLVMDVDREMPSVAWDLLPIQKYRAHNWHCLGRHGADGTLDRQPYVALYTTLGCPFKCSFCCIQAPFKSGEAQLGIKANHNSYRYWSPQRIVDELEMLQREHGVRNVKIADEMFVLNKKHVEAICDGIIERRLDLNIWAYARVDTVKDGMLEKLKKAGFNWLAYGIEAANAEVRGTVQKGFDQADIFTTMKKNAEAGIFVIGNYIFGLPDDTLATMQQTLDLALELKNEFANFYSAMAYPGSQLYQQAIANGWRLPDAWSGYSQHSVDSLPLPTRTLTGAQVLRFRDEAFDRYYTDEAYLAKTADTFGPATVAHLRQMTAHTLKRRHASETLAA